MNFQTYFTIISHLVAGLGLASAGLVMALPLYILGIMAVITAVSLFIHIKGWIFSIPKTLWNAFALSLFSFFLIDYLYITNLLLDPASRFLTVIMIAKLFDLKTNRDYLTLYILAFFQLLAASAANTNLAFLFVFTAYIIVGIWALVIFNLKKDWEEKAEYGQSMPRAVLGHKFFIATTGIALFALVITFLLFFIIPRIGTGFLQRKPAEIKKVSGFSDKVDLGELGPVKLDERVVMRVGLPDLNAPPPFPVYFRGIAFDNYDGISWKQTIKDSVLLTRNYAGVFALKNIGWKEDVLRQEILLEPIGTDVLFAAPFGASISGPLPSRIRLDAMSSIYLPRPPLARIEYTAYSTKGMSQVPNIDNEIYLHLPAGIDAIRELAEKITKDIENPYLKANAIRDFLMKNYRYTLEPKSGKGKTPLDDFLFFTKEGYCEQYATAMAIMFRTVGVPSRLVTGFLKGEWNMFGNYLIVRQRDAHAWVEAYITKTQNSKLKTQNYGGEWLTFDPTPAPESIGEIPVKMSILGLYLDSLRWRWGRYIVHYTFLDQLTLARDVDRRFSSIFYNIKSLAKPKELKWDKMRLDAGFIIILSAVILLLILFISRRFNIKTRQRGSEKAPYFYLKMLEILDKKGIKRHMGKTPLEFADELNIDEVRYVTGLYLKARYGRYTPNDLEVKGIEHSLLDLKKGATQRASGRF